MPRVLTIDCCYLAFIVSKKDKIKLRHPAKNECIINEKLKNDGGEYGTNIEYN